MKIKMLTKRFDNSVVLYSPELKMPETPEIVEECYPAIEYTDPLHEIRKFNLFDSNIGKYEEYSTHPNLGVIYENLGGKKEIERMLTDQYNKVMESV